MSVCDNCGTDLTEYEIDNYEDLCEDCYWAENEDADTDVEDEDDGA